MSRYDDDTARDEDDAYLDDDPIWVEDDRPRRRPGKPRPVLRGIMIFLVGLLVLALGYGGYYFFRVNSAMDSMDRNETMMPSADNRPPAATPAPDAKNAPISFVLIGSDSRGAGEQGLSDVLMVAYLSGDRDALYLVSFPRDMWVDIPGHGESKINAAHSLGGPALTVQTLESLLNTRMDHAVGIDFEGFIKLTTVLGGVTIQNDYESAVGPYYWPIGQITIEGDEALAYVRNRDLPGGDLTRAEHQRKVLSAMIDEVASAGMLANPAKMGQFLDEAADTVTVDGGLTNDKIYSVARNLGFNGSAGVKSLQAPIAGDGTSADGQAVLLVDWARLDELAKAMQTDTMADYFTKYGG